MKFVLVNRSFLMAIFFFGKRSSSSYLLMLRSHTLFKLVECTTWMLLHGYTYLEYSQSSMQLVTLFLSSP